MLGRPLRTPGKQIRGELVRITGRDPGLGQLGARCVIGGGYDVGVDLRERPWIGLVSNEALREGPDGAHSRPGTR